jgi:hypothetical protein
VGATDLIVALAVVAAAGWLLVRTIRRGGACHGCSGGACGRRSEPGPALVTLGRGERARGPQR